MKSPNETNIDEWLFHYFEGDLTPEDESVLEDFLLDNPQFDSQFEAWGASRIQQESFVFPAQEKLKKPVITFAFLHKAAVYTAIAINAAIAGLIVFGNHYNSAQYSHVKLTEFEKDTSDPKMQIVSNNSVDSRSDNSKFIKQFESKGNNVFIRKAINQNFKGLSNTIAVNISNSDNSSIDGLFAPQNTNNEYESDSIGENFPTVSHLNSGAEYVENNQENSSIEESSSKENSTKHTDARQTTVENLENWSTKAIENQEFELSLSSIDLKSTNNSSSENELSQGKNNDNSNNKVSNNPNTTSEESKNPKSNDSRIKDAKESKENNSRDKKTSTNRDRFSKGGDLLLTNTRSQEYLIPGANRNQINFGNVASDISNSVYANSYLQYPGKDNQLSRNQLGYDVFIPEIKSGLGIQMMYSTYGDGAIRDIETSLTYSPKFILKKGFTIEPAVRLKMSSTGVNRSQLQPNTWVEFDRANSFQYSQQQYDAFVSRSIQQDLGLGLLLNSRWGFLGVNADNLFGSSNHALHYGVNDLGHAPVFINAIMGTEFESENKKTLLSMQLIYQNHGDLNKLWLNSRIKHKYISLGAAVSSMGEPMFSVGFVSRSLSILYSTDYSYSRMYQDKFLSHQLLLRMTLKESRMKKLLLN